MTYCLGARIARCFQLNLLLPIAVLLWSMSVSELAIKWPRNTTMVKMRLALTCLLQSLMEADPYELRLDCSWALSL